MNTGLLELKIKYIPLCVTSGLSIRKAADLIGVTEKTVCNLKKKYKEFGMSAFIHGNTGRSPKNRKYDTKQIANDYKKFEGTPFQAYTDDIGYFLGYNPSYSTVYKALRKEGLTSPKPKKGNSKKHKPRKERPCEGELVQLDASKHEWIIGQEEFAIHGGIDDATHNITALYACKNECPFGYNEVLRLTNERFGGFPRAVYTDRLPSLYEIKDSLHKVSIQEQLDGIRKGSTQWQKTCKELEIELIIALSPQAKGRIERLWQTLQGRLPYIFRYLGIKTIDEVNDFLYEFIEKFNKRFSVPAQKPKKVWRKISEDKDLEFVLSRKTEKKTKYDGSFIYHGYKFYLDAPRKSCVDFTLCLSEYSGIRGYMGGVYYPVRLDEPIGDCVGDSMSIVEKELIYKYFYVDMKAGKEHIA